MLTTLKTLRIQKVSIWLSELRLAVHLFSLIKCKKKAT